MRAGSWDSKRSPRQQTNVHLSRLCSRPSALETRFRCFVPRQGNCDEQLLCANLNSVIFDFVTRQKIQGQTLNLFIVEQLPVVPPEMYRLQQFGERSATQIINEAVLELTYTAHDMSEFARDMGHVDATGAPLSPFAWSEERRLMLKAKLDAVFFHLYGVTDREDIRYIYSTFPIVERNELAKYGRYLSRDMCLAWVNALAAGHPDAEIKI